METSSNTACDDIIDEWGQCIWKEEDLMSMETNGVLDGIQQNNPAITAVRVDLFDEAVDDWAAAGNDIGSNRYVRFLRLSIDEIMKPEDVQAFFGGLALNKSIQALRIRFDLVSEDEEEDILFINEIMVALLPWFQFNDNLQVFDLECHDYCDENAAISSCIKDAILACPSLKSIRLKCKQTNWEEETRSILTKKKQVHHLSLTWGSPSKDACSHIKSLLLFKRCVLRSLTLTFDEDPCVSSVNEIIDGLSNNQSLRCINLEFRGKIKSASYGFATAIIDSLREKKLGTIEKFQLQISCLYHGGLNRFPMFPRIHALGQQMPNLKSLSISISGLEFDPVAQSTEHTVEAAGLTSSLRELRMAKFNDQGLNELNSYILRNSSLRVLHLDRQRVSSGLLLSFFNGIQNAKYLESITLNSVITDDAVMESFSNWITSNQSLKALTVTGCEDISSVGWQSFATALASLDNLEDMYSISPNNVDLTDADLDTILNSFIAKPSLKRVSLSITTSAQLQVIANVLESPNCSVIELDITYQDFLNIGRREHERLTETLVNSLQMNSSLRTLKFSLWNGQTYFDWPSVSTLVCDTSSIDATIQSNHTLEFIYGPLNSTEVPIDIYSILHMNRNRNKQAVIREKLIRNHNLDQVNFATSSLPVVFCWLGDAGVDQRLGLSQLFRILRTMPFIIGDKADATRGLKRKIMNDELVCRKVTVE